MTIVDLFSERGIIGVQILLGQGTKAEHIGEESEKHDRARSELNTNLTAANLVNVIEDEEEKHATSKSNNIVHQAAQPCRKRIKSASAARRRSKKTKERTRFECSTCQEFFARRGDLNRHMVKHSDVRPYKCMVCEKTFKRSSTVNNHMQLHSGVTYTCDACGFVTMNKLSLKTHNRRVHQRDFRFRCDRCDKGFMSNYDLEDHKASHLGAKTFVCEHCGNAYSQRSYLVAHKRAVHGLRKTAPKRYPCKLCKNSFASEHGLHNHASLHSQRFLCAQCGKNFTTNHALKLHSRRHTGERPYQCKLCPKAFARSMALRIHEFIHRDEKPYVCDLCGQSFTQRSSMMVHRRKHPGNHPPPPPLLLSRLKSGVRKRDQLGTNCSLHRDFISVRMMFMASEDFTQLRRREWTLVRDGEKCRKMIVTRGDAIVMETTADKGVKKLHCSAKGDKGAREGMKKRHAGSNTEKAINKDSSNEQKTEFTERTSSFESTSQSEDKEDVDQALDEVRTACPFCLKHFDHEKRLKRHIITSHHKKAYKCDKCRASCYTKENLEKHRKSHNDDYFFECDICHLKYKRKVTLRQHQVRAHSDVAAQFICDSCGQSFKVKVDLLVHINRKHSTNVHICRYCGKSVMDLHSHEWKHKKRAEMASLKFSCHVCIKKFQNQTRLDNHLLLHKQGYKCTECNLVVASSRQLQYHKDRMHKPGTICSICKKVFVSRGNKFYQHILTHAGIRPYNCDVCGEDFTQRSSLFRHRRNHPGPLPPYTSQVPIADLARNVLQKLLDCNE
ncbi:hypothetical protein DMN91_005084 [Ooceraea biroi]|uniref:C2H2-type domain-containing protein n=1 Tax=Ooceraea biroi TaxID=2015173 RepID=A0A3L8DR82_OOCBI|nr:hypothetical protein DMN91_005084 [Ooceraea biroi]